MAVAVMAKMRLLGLKSEGNAIIRALQKSGAVELKRTDGIPSLCHAAAPEQREELAGKLQRLSFAIGFLAESGKERLREAKAEKDKSVTKDKKPLFSARTEVSLDNFDLVTYKEIEIFDAVSQLEKFAARLTDLKSEIARESGLMSQLAVYADVGGALGGYTDTKNARILLGTVPAEQVKAFAAFAENTPEAVTELYPQRGAAAAAVVLCHNDDYAKVSTGLTLCGFSRAAFTGEATAAERIAGCEDRIRVLRKQRREALDEAANLKDGADEMKLLYDHYFLENLKVKAAEDALGTERVFLLEGYVPFDCAGDVEREILSVTTNYMLEYEPPGDGAPTLTRNNRVVSPFEAVTDMFSPPRYREIDPNKFVAVFFFLFFGFMMADAGYGLLLAFGAWFITKKWRLEPGFKRTVTVVGICGVSAFVWGVLFGSWFSLDLEPGGPAGFLLSLKLLDPVTDAMTLFIISLGMGVVQILFGMSVKFYALVRAGNGKDAVLDIGTWFLFFISVGCAVLGMQGVGSFADFGMWMILGSLVLIVLTKGRSAKKKWLIPLKGFGGLYDIINYLSDILSYARLFGLALSSAVIGSVFNQIGFMLGMPLGIIVMLIGHTLNLAIGVLGAYIHNCRLQYMEFFGKFYDGEGRAFKPFGGDLKYYVINNKK